MKVFTKKKNILLGNAYHDILLESVIENFVPGFIFSWKTSLKVKVI